MSRIGIKTLVILLLIQFAATACTTAIISGNGTPDGRPLLWKHRDSGFENNKLMHFNDGKFEYVGLVNSADSTGREIWAGANSAGFAIMNSASYNLNNPDTAAVRDSEGIVMKKALQNCATVDDFEQMLTEWPAPIGVEANFGVIDADGSGAYFESGNAGFTRIDVTDPTVAPDGYLIRTNYSFTGQKDEGYGYIRYLTAENMFYQASAENQLDYRFLLQEASRNLSHSLTGQDLLAEGRNLPENASKFIPLQDFIVRNSSVSTVVVQGVKRGEDAALTTMWTVLGFQLSAVAVPAWPAAGNQLPNIVQAPPGGTAELCDLSLKLKNKCFPIQRGSGNRYVLLPRVVNSQGTGIWQKLQPVENQILLKTEASLASWRTSGLKKNQIGQLNQWLDDYVISEMESILK